MAPSLKRSLRSLQTVIENASPEFRGFFFQDDENFVAIASEIAEPFQPLEEEDNEENRNAVIAAINDMKPEVTLPSKSRVQRVLLLTNGKGPSALKVIAEEELSNEEYEAAFAQLGELAVALHVHAHHRRAFDDAVSFRNARLWRDGKLYSAFDVDLEHPKPVDANAIPKEQKLLAAVRLRLKLSVDCGMSVVDLPATEAYKPSVLVIIRIPKDITGIPEHLDNGGRRLRFLRPQKEVLLIYTPVEQRIEICADTAPERALVSECFATEVLGHDVSTKPLTWVNYELEFFRTLTLYPPAVPGFLVDKTALVEIEVRLARWKQRLRLSVPFGDEIEKTAQSSPGARPRTAARVGDLPSRHRGALPAPGNPTLRPCWRSRSRTVTAAACCSAIPIPSFAGWGGPFSPSGRSSTPSETSAPASSATSSPCCWNCMTEEKTQSPQHSSRRGKATRIGSSKPS